MRPHSVRRSWTEIGFPFGSAVNAPILLTFQKVPEVGRAPVNEIMHPGAET
jgi:hypothetical protein